MFNSILDLIKAPFFVFNIKSKDNTHLHSIGYFKRGFEVQAKSGEQGTVWRVVRNAVTNEIVGCIVVWNTNYKGKKFSIHSAQDYGTDFNPDIRKIPYLQNPKKSV